MKLTANQIAQMVQGEVVGNGEVEISDVCTIEDGKQGCITFLYDKRYLQYLPHTRASVVLLSRSLEFEGSTSATLIMVDNARAAVAMLLKMVEEVLAPKRRGIEQPVFIASDVEVPEDAYVGAFAYIGKNVRLGKGVQIYPQVYIGDDVEIGDNTVLYAGVKVYHHCKIGNNCIIQAGAVIGADGFGFEADNTGVNQKISQVGIVVIEDDVEIGANATVDRAMMGKTIVHNNVKIDNLVQVAHSVEVGEGTVLCAQVGIAGSSKVGAHCILAGQVGMAGHIEVVDNCILGAKTGVPGSILKSGVYLGSPAQPISEFKRCIAVFRNLPELRRLVRDLQSVKK